MRSASPIFTPAWTSIRFLGACWRGNWRRCGRCSGGPRSFGPWKRPQAPAGSPRRCWISPRAQLGSFYEALRYVAVEQSAARRDEHGRDTGSASFTRTRDLGRGASAGDSRRVHSLERTARCLARPSRGVQRGALREMYVGLCTARRTCRSNLGRSRRRSWNRTFASRASHCARDSRRKLGLEACRWIAEAGKRLGRGFVLTVDYGHEAAELYNERHMRGHAAGLFAASGERGFSARAR